MHVRPMLSTDIYDVGTLADEAFREDEFWRSLTPGMYQYPADRPRFYRLRTRGRFVTKGGCVALLAVTDEKDADWNGKEEIAGYSFWQREGISEQAKQWQKEPWGASLERALLWAEMQYERYFVNHAMDWKKWDEMVAMFGALHKAAVPEHWHTLVLGVSPKYRRRGVGSLLLDWGKEMAREEGVPVVLESTPQGVPLYEAVGFRKILVAGAKQMPAYVTTNMMWEPESRQGEWLTDAMVQRSRSEVQGSSVAILH